MKIYEVCCDSNSIGFYFSKAKAMAEVRRRIIVDNEIDYPDYNPNFLSFYKGKDKFLDSQTNRKEI